MRRLITHLIPVCGALTVALLPRLAFAQECGADAPCPDGFTCETGMTEACPTIACAEGSDCVLPDCTPTEYSYCTPKTCDPAGAADQCGAGMVCVSYESGGCTASGGVACPEGADCPAVEPVEPVCTTETVSQCQYQYTQPCTTDESCGAGFTCKSYDVCSGGGSVGVGTPSSGGTDPGSAGSDPAPLPPETDPSAPVIEGNADGGAGVIPGDIVEECTPSEVKYCEVIPVTCETIADCADGWTCEQPVVYSGCTTTGAAGDAPVSNEASGTGGAASSGDPGAAPAPDSMRVVIAADGGTPVVDDGCPEPMVLPKQCMPPGYSYFAAADGVAISESGGVALGGANPTDQSANDSASGTPTSNTGDGEGAPITPGATATGNQSSSDAKGCSFGGGASTPSNAGLFGLMLGFAALVSRRKR